MHVPHKLFVCENRVRINGMTAFQCSAKTKQKFIRKKTRNSAIPVIDFN